MEQQYRHDLQAFLKRDTQELPTIGIHPLSTDTCARINALIQYGKGIVVECAYEDEMIPIGAMMVHPYYDDMLLISRKGTPDLYLMIPGYSMLSLRFYERKKEVV